jgi:predicted nucleotidyltransferase component of viral defense system
LSSADEYKNALKEIIQEIALLGLFRANFFDIAAFYGGTALRIL